MKYRIDWLKSKSFILLNDIERVESDCRIDFLKL